MPFIVFESIDGAGKGTISKILISMLLKETFDVNSYASQKGFLPQFLDEKKDFYVNPNDYEIFKTSEPTFVGVGRNIREHVLKFKKLKYSPFDIALQFSLDRRTLYERVIIPLKKKNKTIIQERSVVSSLVYQVEHSKFFGGKPITIEDVISLEGNKIALKKENMFDLLFILYLPFKEVSKRLKKRKKFDDVFYETEKKFQKQLLDSYLSEELQKFLLKQNPNLKIVYLDVSKPLEGQILKIKIIYDSFIKGELKTINYF